MWNRQIREGLGFGWLAIKLSWRGKQERDAEKGAQPPAGPRHRPRRFPFPIYRSVARSRGDSRLVQP